MSIRRRTARRASDRAAAISNVADIEPRLDRAFVISFLELDPEVAAALNGEAYEPPVTSVPQSAAAPFAFENLEIFRTPVEPTAPSADRSARVIDIPASVRPLAEEDSSQKARGARRTRQRKTTTRRSKIRAAAAAERVAAIKEVKLNAPADRVAAADEILREPASALHAAPVEEIQPVPEARVLHIEPPIEEFSAVEPAVALHPIRPPAPVQPAAATERRNLPVQHIDHERLMLAVQAVGWKMPPATRRQWSYMNFNLPPDPKANMTPRQIKRQEWRDMIKYFRISPYKSHYREDQKATKRLLGQARRARLDVA